MMKFNSNATKCQHRNGTGPHTAIFVSEHMAKHNILVTLYPICSNDLTSYNSFPLPKLKFEIEGIFGNKVTENNAKELTASTKTRSLELGQDYFRSDQFQKHVNYLTLHILPDHSQNFLTGHRTCGYNHHKPCKSTASKKDSALHLIPCHC